jgi:prevent-host-death family protein
MKKTYTYSEARQKFASVLREAEQEGEARIVRKNGTVFVIRPEKRKRSPLDVGGVSLGISREEILDVIREGRERPAQDTEDR